MYMACSNYVSGKLNVAPSGSLFAGRVEIVMLFYCLCFGRKPQGTDKIPKGKP